MPAPLPRHLRARPRRLSAPLRWLLLAALTVPLVAGLAGPGQRPAAAAAGSPAATAIRYALAQLGKPYQWGAEGPNSFDCSGLVQTAYRKAGISLPRVSRSQYGAGKLVPLSALRPSDLLFYAHNTRDRRTIYHVGMYLGAGPMVEAPNRRARSGSPPPAVPAWWPRRPGRPRAGGPCSRSSSASAARPWPPSSSGWPPTGSVSRSTATSVP
jgi:cell wall-associated NlpC family hydrolase